MVDLNYEFELPREPLDGSVLDEAKLAELSEVLQTAVVKFRNATYQLLVKNGQGMKGAEILTKLRIEHNLDAKRLHEALNVSTIDRLMNQPFMRRHFKLTTIDWLGEEKQVWKAVPTDENRLTIEKNAAAIMAHERNEREAQKQRLEMIHRRMTEPGRGPLRMNNSGPPRRADGRTPSRQWPSRAVPAHSAPTRTPCTPTRSTTFAQPGPSRGAVARTNTQAVRVPAATARVRPSQESIDAAAAALGEVPPDPHPPRRVRFGGIEVFTLEPADAEPEARLAPAEPQPEVTDDYIKSLVETKLREVKPNTLNIKELDARLGRINPAIKTFFNRDVALLRKFLEEKCTSFVDMAAVYEEVFIIHKQSSS